MYHAGNRDEEQYCHIKALPGTVIIKGDSFSLPPSIKQNEQRKLKV
jgi:hypothetical protein